MSQPRQGGKEFFDPKEIKRMSQELKKENLFENGMSPTDMRNLLQVLSESQKAAAGPANPIDQNVTENKTTESTPPTSQTSYADKLSSSFSGTSERKSASPEQSSSRLERALSQDKQHDSINENIYSPGEASNFHSKESKDLQKSNSNVAQTSTSMETTGDGKNDNKQQNYTLNAKIRKENNFIRIRFNPLDPIGKFKDEQALVPIYRSYVDPKREQANVVVEESSDDVNDTIDEDEKNIARLCNHLRQVAHIYHRRSLDETKFQWGAPIKIGETNGSYDRNVINDNDEDTEDTINTRETSSNDNNVNVTTRRRRVCTSKSAIYDYGDGSNDERDNSDDDFEIGAKRKKIVVSSSAGKKLTSTKAKKSLDWIATSETIPESSVTSNEVKTDDSAIFVDVSDECTITDDETSEQPPKKMQRSKSAEAEPVYPRRIVPGTSKKWYGIRARKPLVRSSSDTSRVKKPIDEEQDEDRVNEEKSRIADSSKNNCFGLGTEEIAEVLEQIENNDDDVTPIPISDDVDIRPLRVSTRMKIQGQRLLQFQERDKEKERIVLQQEIIKDEKIRRDKMVRIQQRVREENERQRQQEELDRQKSQKEENWRNFVQGGDKKRANARTDIHPDGRPQHNEAISGVEENNFMMNEDEDEIISNSARAREPVSNRVRCPICNRGFTSDEIEAHAGACEEYDSCPPGISRSSSPSLTPPRVVSTSRRGNFTTYECEVCSKFSTQNGKQYENHLTECIRRKREQITSDTIVEVPTSPLRTVRTISEQTDSEINYKSQFVPKTKSNRAIGKKRKR